VITILVKLNQKMDIKKLLREKLESKESKNDKYDYGCVMLFLDVPKKEWVKLQDLIDNEDDLYFEENNDGFGRENEPHVTILYGIHADVPDEDVEKLIKEIKEPKIELKKVSTFKNEKFDVLKFDVESEDLQKLNKKFKTLPHTSTYPDYHPHVTIAYMNKGVSDQYIKALNDNEPIKVKIKSIVYSKPDKTQKTYKI
jgi:2'-5' RNA ligase